MKTSPVLLTAEQVAEMLQLPRASIYALARDGKIPVIRISARRFRFDQADIERWLDRRTTTRPRTAA